MTTRRLARSPFLALLSCLPFNAALFAATVATGPTFSVVELTFQGPTIGPTDTPAKDVEFSVRFQHESGAPEYRIHGFWDGDGKGGARGGVFKVRFCPTKSGRWKLVEVASNHHQLTGQNQGDVVQAAASRHAGFWLVDDQSAERRWYRRTDGSHAYILGNTLYTVLSETKDTNGTPNGSSIARDIKNCAEFYNKIRFSVIADVNPHPVSMPFFDESGKPTRDGNHSHRLNPEWFTHRVDLAVRTAAAADTIADMIISGVDTEEARSALLPAGNGQDYTPFLRYVAARYGAFPNVWFCLINEFPIRIPAYTPEQIIERGKKMREFLPYANPLSVHGRDGAWNKALNTTPAWNDHLVFQRKIKNLYETVDWMQRSFANGGGDKPVFDDELSYQGAGDQHSEEDTIEALLGAFLGGGYGSTAHKDGAGVRQPDRQGKMWTVGKTGQYLQGNFDPTAHSASDNLKWLRGKIDAHVTFWQLRPAAMDGGIFAGAHKNFRALAWPDREYVLGTDTAQTGIVARLPAGKWTVRRLDAIALRDEVLATDASGDFRFDAPAARAVLFHFKRLP